MKIAIDFDNTIIDYSELFHKAATLEDVPVDKNSSKNKIKELIKSHDDFEWPKKWIDIQGRCYGELIHESSNQEDFLNTYRYFKEQGFEVQIVSHKSTKSLCGRYNLRESALAKIKKLGIQESEVHFFDTLENKCDYLYDKKFDVIIDDLVEILDKTKNDNLKILFGSDSREHFSLKSWKIIYDFFKCLKKLNFSPTSIECLGKSSYVLKNSREKYFFKIFLDKERAFRERESYKLNIRNNVSVVYKSETLLVEEYIKFEQVRKIDKWFCHEYEKSFHALQENILEINFQATHGIKTEKNYIDNLNQRIENIRNIIDRSLLKRIEILLEQISTKVELSDTPIDQYVCLPDFFKHNFGRIGDELVIFDYESFGLDDLARTFLNAIHHLGNTLEKDEFSNLIDLFSDLSKENPLFWHRVKKFYDLIALEWVLIASKNHQNLTKSKSLVTIMENNRDQGQNFWSWNKPVVDLINERF